MKSIRSFSKSGNKYRNVKTEVDGIIFASKKEAWRYSELKLLERAGEISHLELQPRIKIVIGGVKVRLDTGRQVVYIGDFRYYDNTRKHFVIEETKGFKTPAYKLKKAMVRAMGIDIIES